MKIKLIAKIKDVIIGYVFDTDTNITIGREIGNTIAPIIDSISRHHAHIFFENGEWKVEDLGSTNGSLVNGQKAEGKVTLKTGDSMRFGLIDMSVTLEADAAAVPPAAAPAAPAMAPIAPPKPAPAVTPVSPLEPVAPAKPAAMSPIRPTLPGGIKKPVIGGIKPGLKLPPKPGLSAGIKLPPKPALKLPPNKA